MVRGRPVKLPARAALLHDESGRDWPSCSALVMPIHPSRGDEPVRDRAAQSYFNDQPMGCSVELPPRSLSSWRALGEISEILYTRRRPHGLPGQLQDDFYHPIEKGKARLYRLGHVYRIELGPRCQWNWRGIVRP